MIGAALILLASGISLPDSGNQLAGYIFSKIEGSEFDSKVGWSVATLNVWVEPNGRIATCSVGRSAGDERIPKLYCPVLLNLRIDFPKDENGRKTYAFMAVDVAIFSDSSIREGKKLHDALEAKPNLGDPDGDLQIANPSVREGEQLEINIDVGPDGHVKACEKSRKLPSALVVPACAAARAKMFVIRRSESGEPVAYVRAVQLIPAQTGS